LASSANKPATRQTTPRRPGAKPKRTVPDRTETRGDRNIRWIEHHCRIPEGRFVGQPLVLTPKQQHWVKRIYDTPTRTFILSMGRKGAKTVFAACITLLHLAGPESRVNSQLFSAAQSREQAAILFTLAAKMVRMSPTLSKFVHVRDAAKQLFCEGRGTLYRALSAEATTAYGFSPALNVHDELGQVVGPKSELYNALETAAAAQDEPLSIIISTQSPNDADLLSVLIDDALAGNDPRVKVELYTADEAMDPFSEEAIRAANPHYDVFMNQEEVKRQAQEAKRMPSREASYRNLVLNQRISLHNPFVSRSLWDACSAAPDEDVLRNAPVHVGLDLSSRHDLTAIVVAARDGEDWHLRPYFFAPREGVVDRARRDRVPYDVWAKQGHLILTAGNVVDYEVVAKTLRQIQEDCELQMVMFDRWRIEVLKAELSKLGYNIPLSPFGQGFKDMTPALEVVESALISGKIRHGGHPILRWCAANAIATHDPAGNRKLDKAKATGRIDGMIAMVMAMGASGGGVKKSVEPQYQFFTV
jgi:phage terminase large subunit-like protein